MLLGQVVGTVVSTRKDAGLSGLKLLVVRELDDALKPTGHVVVSADAVGAGRDEVVLVSAGSSLTDALLLPQCHPDVFVALEGQAQGPAGEALGVIETAAVPATLLAADKAAKTAPIQLRVIRLANHLGGKGFVYLDGTVSDVNASVRAAREAVGGQLVDATVIPRLSESVRDRLY